MANISDIKQRFDDLNSRYLNKCLLSENVLIIELMKDFINFKSQPGSEIFRGHSHIFMIMFSLNVLKSLFSYK